MLPSLSKFVGPDQLVQLPLNKLQEMHAKIVKGENLDIPFPLSSVEEAIKVRKHVDLTQQAEQAENELNSTPPDVSHLIKGISAIPMPDNALRMAGGGIVSFAKGEDVKGPERTFVEQFGPMAQQIAEEKGIPVEVVLAQAALESGWGKSRPGNNLFGVKAGPGWTGAKNTLATKEFIDGRMVDRREDFRAYERPEDSMKDWASVLDQPRYRQAVETARKDPMAYPAAVAKAGYATDPDYARKLTGTQQRVRQMLGENWRETPAGPSQYAYRTLSPQGAQRGIGTAAPTPNAAPREESLEEEFSNRVAGLRKDQQDRLSEARKYYEGRRGEIKDPTAPDEEKIRREMAAQAESRDRPMIEAMRAQAAGMRPDEEAARRRAFQNALIEGGAAMADPRNGGRGIAGVFRAFTAGVQMGNRAYDREVTVMEAAKQKAMEAEQEVNKARYKAATDRDRASEAAVTNAMREYRTDMNGIKSLRASINDRERAEITALSREFGIDFNMAKGIYENGKKTAAAEAKTAAAERAAADAAAAKEDTDRRRAKASQVTAAQRAINDAQGDKEWNEKFDRVLKDIRRENKKRAAKDPSDQLPEPNKNEWITNEVLKQLKTFGSLDELQRAANEVSGRPEPTAPATAPAAPAPQRIKLFP